MRYRLMASYLGGSYQAAVGPSDRDVTLFAAPPPPEEHGFSPAPGGIWRKQVRLDDLGALWESRPIGSYHGEPCLVLDDLGDRLHIVYLGMDQQRAAQLGYWEVDRGVFEVVVPRYDVTDLAEERHEFPIALLLSALPRALGAGDSGQGAPGAMSQGGLANGQNGAGPVPPGRAIGAIGAGAAAAGTVTPPATVNGQGPGAARGWNPPGAPAQLPAAMSPQAAAASVQYPFTGAYQAPVLPGHNGAGLPGALRLPGALGAPGGPQFAEMAQPPGGGQLPGGPQAPGLPPGAGVQHVPAGQLAIAAPGQGAPAAPGVRSATGAVPLSAPAMAYPGRPQLPAADQQQAQQAGGQPFPAVAPFSAAPQAPAAPQAAQAQGFSPQSPGAQQPQAPTAVAAWHGSPAADGNGQWYYQPAVDPQQAAAAVGGYGLNGAMQNGYAQQGQGTAQAVPSNGIGLAQQYVQPAQQAPVTGYQQAQVPPGQQPPQAQQAQQALPAQSLQQPLAQQPAQVAQFQQPTAFQPGTQPPPTVQQAPAQGPQFATAPAPQAPPAPTAQQAPAAQAPLPTATAAVATGTPEPVMPTVGPGPQAAGPAAAMTAPQTPQAQVPQAQAAAPVIGMQAAALAPAPSLPSTGPGTAPLPAPGPAPEPVAPPPPAPTAPGPESGSTGPLTTLPPAAQPDHASSSGLTAAGALSKLTGAVRGRRAARKPRLAMSAIFADLVDMADIPRSAYSVDEEITGAMCLFKTEGGYEVFSCAEDARHEVRFFEEEEAAYFYLFGVLAAEALRNGRLSPRRG